MRFSLAVVATVATRTAVARDVPEAKQIPAETPNIGENTSQGCFSAKSGDMTELKMSRLSTGFCFQECRKADEDYTVAVLGTSNCFCGLEYPPEDALVDDESCSFPCAAYPLEVCGGLSTKEKDRKETSYFSVWNLGVKVAVPYAKGGADEEDKSEEENSQSDKGMEPDKEDGEGDKDENGDKDEHHSPTPLWQPSETASETFSTSSITPSGNESEDDNDDADNIAEETTSSTEPPTPEPSATMDSVAASNGLNRGIIAGSIFATAILASAL